MSHRTQMYRAAVLTLIALVIAVQPFGVLSHVVHDHLDGHSHAAHPGVAIHVEDVDAADHDTDHSHVWMTPAAAVVACWVGRPQIVAALGIAEDLPWPSATLFPPFSPPRA